MIAHTGLYRLGLRTWRFLSSQVVLVLVQECADDLGRPRISSPGNQFSVFVHNVLAHVAEAHDRKNSALFSISRPGVPDVILRCLRSSRWSPFEDFVNGLH